MPVDETAPGARRLSRQRRHAAYSADRKDLPCQNVKPVPRRLRVANREALAMPRSAPVSPLTVSGGRYVVSALPDSDWARNVRAAWHA